MDVLNLHHLRLFRAVATDGTLTGAARWLNLSQSALSTQIKTLEATLGHDLFERRGRGLVLTEAGRIALVMGLLAPDFEAIAAGLTRARAAGKVCEKQGSADLDHPDPRQQSQRPQTGRH